MLGSLHLQARASRFLGSTGVFARRWTPLLQRAVGSSFAAVSTLSSGDRQRPFLLQRGAVGTHTDLATGTSSKRKGCVYFLQDKGLSHTSESRGGDDDFIHLFPAGAVVERMEAATKHNVLTMGPRFTVVCDRPLSVRDIEEVMCHLNKKIQSLRTCLRYVDNELWICELKKPKLDFKVLTGDSEAEMYKLLNLGFNSSEGPLWRARVIFCDPSDPCPVPDLRHQFPYQYVFMLSFHHGTHDGISGLMVVTRLLELLEDLIKKVPIDDGQFGKMVSFRHSEQIEESIRSELEKDPQRFDGLLKDLSKRQFKSLLDEAFGVPEASQPKVRTLQTVIDTSVNKFIEKCRSTGVTFNSGFTSVINTALVELVREAGLVRDVYSVTSRHAIDERRYWGGSVFQDFGCHMGAMSHIMMTPHNNRQNFWEYAKMFDTEFRGKVRDKHLFQERILRSMNFPADLTYDAYYSTPPPLLYDYFFSSMYTPDFSNMGCYDHLRMTELVCHQNAFNCEYSSFHLIVGSPGRVVYDISYSASRMTDETCRRFRDKVVLVFHEVANE